MIEIKALTDKGQDSLKDFYTQSKKNIVTKIMFKKLGLNVKEQAGHSYTLLVVSKRSPNVDKGRLASFSNWLNNSYKIVEGEDFTIKIKK